MNLEEYLAANPAATLADAQAYSENGTGKLISPDLMLAFLTSFGLVNLLDSPLENPNTAMTKESKALRKAFEFGSEFNLINGHPSSVKPMLDQMFTDGLVSQQFIDYCVAYANPVLTPLAHITQADYDNAKALIALKTNPITNQDALYLSGATYLSPSNYQKTYIEIEIAVGDEVAHDDTLVVTAFHKMPDATDFVEVDIKRAVIHIKSNSSGKKAYLVNTSNLLPEFKLKVSSKFNRVFVATAYAV